MDGSFHVRSTRNRDTSNIVVSAQGVFEFTLSRLLTSKILEGGFLLLWGTSTLALIIFRIDEPRIGRGWLQDGGRFAVSISVGCRAAQPEPRNCCRVLEWTQDRHSY